MAISDESPGLNTLASVNLLAGVVIEWWNLNALEYRPGHEESASVKLLGRSIGVTSSCLAFELSTGRVTSASVVIE